MCGREMRALKLTSIEKQRSNMFEDRVKQQLGQVPVPVAKDRKSGTARGFFTVRGRMRLPPFAFAAPSITAVAQTSPFDSRQPPDSHSTHVLAPLCEKARKHQKTSAQLGTSRHWPAKNQELRKICGGSARKSQRQRQSSSQQRPGEANNNSAGHRVLHT